MQAEERQWIRKCGLETTAQVLDRDWDRMLTFYQFPEAHWVHLRTDAAKRFKNVENATAVIWKMLLVAQQRFRCLNASELLQEVYYGAQYVNGVRVTARVWEAVA